MVCMETDQWSVVPIVPCISYCPPLTTTCDLSHTLVPSLNQLLYDWGTKLTIFFMSLVPNCYVSGQKFNPSGDKTFALYGPRMVWLEIAANGVEI